jgi:hypothetical protein
MKYLPKSTPSFQLNNTNSARSRMNSKNWNKTPGQSQPQLRCHGRSPSDWIAEGRSDLSRLSEGNIAWHTARESKRTMFLCEVPRAADCGRAKNEHYSLPHL